MNAEGFCACGAVEGDGTVAATAAGKRMAEYMPRCVVCGELLDIDEAGYLVCPNRLNCIA